MTSADQGEDEGYKIDMERCFAALDPLMQRRQSLPVEPRSDFALDEEQLPEPAIDDWSWMLLHVALDHVETLRVHSGRLPRGMGIWPVHSPWTLVRGALEAASQLVWMVGSDDRDTRLERLLRFVHEDNEQYEAATLLTHRPDKVKKKEISDHIKATKEDFERVSSPWVGKAHNRIRTDMNILECIQEAGRLSEVVVNPDLAVQTWRIAGGYAHGRPWAHISTGNLVELEKLDDRTSRISGSIDFR